MSILRIFGLYFKKLHKTKLLIFILCLVMIAGCDLYFPMYVENTATEPIDIEVLRPADTIISQSIKKILVFTKPGLIPKVILMDGKNHFTDKILFEKTVENEFHSMGDLLSTTPRFEILEPINPIKPPKNKFYNWNEIDSICINADVDACLFLSNQEVFLGIRNSNSTNSESQPRGAIWVTSTYEFYSPKEQIAITKEVKTGVEFQTEGSDKLDFFESLSELESLVMDYSAENGEKFAGWFAPVWNRDTRDYYITGNKELESVKNLISLEKWDEVFRIWRNNTHSGNRVAAKHASFNTIISYEMEGKLDSALYFARDAYKRFRSEEIINYGLILEERIREHELVNTQLGIQNNN
jgi:Family of unknown function (DUF6340)